MSTAVKLKTSHQTLEDATIVSHHYSSAILSKNLGFTILSKNLGFTVLSKNLIENQRAKSFVSYHQLAIAYTNSLVSFLAPLELRE